MDATLSLYGLARHDFMYEFRGPRSTLDLGSALGAGDAGRDEARDCSRDLVLGVLAWG